MKENPIFIHPAFNKEYSNSYYASIELNSKELTYLIQEQEHHTPMVLGVCPVLDKNTSLNDIIAKHEYLSLPYQKTGIMASTYQSTLIPEPLFDKSNLENYVTLNFTQKPSTQIEFDFVQSLQAYNIYLIPYMWKTMPKENSVLRHSSSVFLENIMIRFANSHKKGVYVYINNDYITIAVLENQQLRFVNSYEAQTKEDIVYYILNVYKQLNLNNLQDNLWLFGKIDKKDDTYDLLYRYIQHISFAENPTNNQFEFSYHSYYNLLNQYLCE